MGSDHCQFSATTPPAGTGPSRLPALSLQSAHGRDLCVLDAL